MISIILFVIDFYFKNTSIVPAFGGILKEGVVGQPRFINPIYADSNDVDKDLVNLIFSGLMKYGKDGKIEEDIAKSYEIKEGGRVYIGSYIGPTGERLYCLDAESGKTLWTFEAGCDVFTPTVYDGKVYLGALSYLGGEYLKLYCLDAEMEWLIWDYQPGSRSCSGSGFFSTVVNGKVYTGCENGRVYCFDAKSGKLIWSYNTGKRILSTPAVVNGRIYVGSNSCKLYCLEEE